MNGNKYIEEFVIPSYLTDSSRRLSPSSVLAVAQDLSYKGAERLGIGEQAMSAQGMAWVLCRARFVVNRAPAMFEQVILETWHKGISGPYFIRNYRIRDNEGNELVNATSSCVLIDIKSRMPFRIDRLQGFRDIPPQCGDSSLDGNAEKINIPQGEYSQTELEHTIGYTDTDFVGHTNNTNYLKWVMDCESLNKGLLHPGDVTVNFIRETSAGERICFKRLFSDGISFLTGTVDGKCVMKAKLVF